MIRPEVIASLEMLKSSKKDAFNSVIDTIQLACGGIWVAKAELESGYSREEIMKHLDRIDGYLTDIETLLVALKNI